MTSMNASENPFRRQETCGGCQNGLVGLLGDQIIPPFTEQSHRKFILEEGFVVCLQQCPNMRLTREALESASSPCAFGPSRYIPVIEGKTDRFFRYLRTASRLVAQRISTRP